MQNRIFTTTSQLYATVYANRAAILALLALAILVAMFVLPTSLVEAGRAVSGS